jgi:hypothetical protein
MIYLVIGIAAAAFILYQLNQGPTSSSSGPSSSGPSMASALPPGPSGATSANCVSGQLHWFDVAGNDLGQVTNADGTPYIDTDC